MTRICDDSHASPAIAGLGRRRGWSMAVLMVAVAMPLVVVGSARCRAELIPDLDVSTSRTAASQVALDDFQLVVSGKAGLAELESAIAEYRRGAVDEARQWLGKASAANAHLPPAAVMLARLHLAAGQKSAGRQQLEAAAVEHADSGDVHLAFGDFALAEGRVADAQLHFARASQLCQDDPTDSGRQLLRAQLGLAAVAERRQQWPEAERRLREAIRVDNRQVAPLRRLARAQFQQQRFEDAEKTLRYVRRLDESGQPAELTLAGWHARSGRSEEAERLMVALADQATGDQRAEDVAETLVALALWHLETDRPQTAQDFIDRLVEADPEHPQRLRLAGLAARAVGDLETAESCFQQLMLDQPDDFAITNQLVLVLIDQQDEAKQKRALQLAEMNARLHDHPARLVSLGWVHHRLGRSDQAWKTIQPVLSGPGLSAENAYFVAHLLAAQGLTQEAMQAFQQASEARGYFVDRQRCIDQVQRLREIVSREPSATGVGDGDMPETE